MEANTHIEPEVADIVVVGGGGAGLAAAVSAATRGMRTVLLEKCAELGGTTRYSVGSFCAAGTRLQRHAGIADSADDFRSDMGGFVPEYLDRDNPSLRAVLAAEAGVTLQWLEALGVVFAGPFPEPPNRVSRMHNVIPGSRMYIAKLSKAAKRAGASIRLGARVQGLVTGGNGTVSGLDYVHDGRRRRLHARRGVILASGDFSGNRTLRETFLAPAAAAAIPVNPSNTGDGHELAKRVGAAWRNMDVVLGPQYRFPRAPRTGFTDRLPAWSWLARMGAYFLALAPSWMLKPVASSLLIAHMSPTERLFQEGALLVDLDGGRLNTAQAAASLALARGAAGYIVLDERIAGLFTKYPYYISTAPGIAFAYFSDYVRGRPDIVHRGGTGEELAGRLGMPADRLRASLEGSRLSGGALFALGPVNAMLTITEGGLVVDEQCRVLREDGEPVEGLYAAGGVGQGGMTLRGHGLHIAWALTSGRIAGEMAARRLPLDVAASGDEPAPVSVPPEAQVPPAQ